MGVKGFDPQCVNDLINKVPELQNKELKILNPCAAGQKFAEQLIQKGYQVDQIGEEEFVKNSYKGIYDVILTSVPTETNARAAQLGFNQILIKMLREVKPGGMVCNFQKMAQLESKSRYEDIYMRSKPKKVLVYSKRIKEFNDERVINSTVCYNWVIWQKDLYGFYSNKMVELDWIYR